MAIIKAVIARGFLTERKLKEIHYYMNNVIFKKTGFKIDNFEYCPFHKDSKITKYIKEIFKKKTVTRNDSIILKKEVK